MMRRSLQVDFSCSHGIATYWVFSLSLEKREGVSSTLASDLHSEEAEEEEEMHRDFLGDREVYEFVRN